MQGLLRSGSRSRGVGQGDWMGKVQSSDANVGNAGAGALANSEGGLPSMPGTHGSRRQQDD